MNDLKNTSNAPDQSIVITDSGLGGLSVFNDLANRLKKKSPWPSVRMTYVNAWPAPHRGYNHFKSFDRKNRVFNRALNSMRQFDPDQILIACNTLSVIYPETDFFKRSGIPIEGIVDHGIQMLFEKLSRDPDSVCVILGTPTTTMAKSHEQGLKKLGISKKRIVNMGCTNLAGFIERNPFSDEIVQMIDGFAQQTGDKLHGFSGNVYAGLCCTHFGYKTSQFKTAFDQFVPGTTHLLNPNVRMAEKIACSGQEGNSGAAAIDMKLVSQAVWTDDQIQAYLDLIPDMSTQLQAALKNYRHDEQLFATD